MKQVSWVGILSVAAVLAAGIAAWAAESEGARAMQAVAPSLLAGQDLTGVSAPPARTLGTGDEGDASQASGPPRKSIRSQA